MTAKKLTSKAAESKGFTEEERAAIKERAKETRRGGSSRERDGESEILAKIAEMSAQDRAMAERIHAIVTTNAPELKPTTWYGMPAYSKDGKIVCFFQNAAKFKARYAEFGFNDAAALDDGGMWPVRFAIKELTAKEEAKIVALVEKAIR